MQPTLTAEYLASQGLSSDVSHRFWNFVRKDGVKPKHGIDLNECWRWIGAKSGPNRDYGYISRGIGNSRSTSAHRVSWIIHNGPIPKGMCVCHACDNPECTNPDHLWLGTHVQNVRDCVTKGRNAKRDKMAPKTAGEKHYRTKLTWEKVAKIRELFKTTEITYGGLAKMYGVRYHTIWQIIKRPIWNEKFR